ncbi:hypothetical protein V8C86DRAFT_833152 [Haematococcus lacustris]
MRCRVIVPVIQLPTSGQQAADKIYRDASQLPSHHSTLLAQSIGPGTPSQAPHDPIPPSEASLQASPATSTPLLRSTPATSSQQQPPSLPAQAAPLVASTIAVSPKPAFTDQHPPSTSGSAQAAAASAAFAAPGAAFAAPGAAAAALHHPPAPPGPSADIRQLGPLEASALGRASPRDTRAAASRMSIDAVRASARSQGLSLSVSAGGHPSHSASLLYSVAAMQPSSSQNGSQGSAQPPAPQQPRQQQADRAPLLHVGTSWPERSAVSASGVTQSGAANSLAPYTALGQGGGSDALPAAHALGEAPLGGAKQPWTGSTGPGGGVTGSSSALGLFARPVSGIPSAAPPSILGSPNPSYSSTNTVTHQQHSITTTADHQRIQLPQPPQPAVPGQLLGPLEAAVAGVRPSLDVRSVRASMDLRSSSRLPGPLPDPSFARGVHTSGVSATLPPTTWSLALLDTAELQPQQQNASDSFAVHKHGSAGGAKPGGVGMASRQSLSAGGAGRPVEAGGGGFWTRSSSTSAAAAAAAAAARNPSAAMGRASGPNPADSTVAGSGRPDAKPLLGMPGGKDASAMPSTHNTSQLMQLMQVSAADREPQHADAHMLRPNAATAAVQELSHLETQRQQLEQQVARLQTSPAALQLLQLQHKLLDLQAQEVVQLEAQVAGMANVDQRLQELRKQAAELDAAEEESMVLESRMALAKEQRQIHDAMATAESEAEAAQLREHVAALHAGAAEVQALKREIAELAGCEVVLAKMRARHAELAEESRQLAELEVATAALEADAERAAALAARQQLLASQAARLPELQTALAEVQAQVARVEGLEAEVERLQQKVQAGKSLELKLQHLQQEQAEQQQQAEQQATTSVQPVAVPSPEHTVQHASKFNEQQQQQQEEEEEQAQELVRLRELQAERAEAAAEAERLRQLVADLPALKAEVEKLGAQARQLPALQAQQQELSLQASAAAQLSEQCAALRKEAADLPSLQMRASQLLAEQREVAILQQQIEQMSSAASELPRLRQEHAELSASIAEANLLRRDAEVLTLQRKVQRQMSLRESFDGDAASQPADGLLSGASSLVATSTQREDENTVSTGPGAALEGLFSRLRQLEAEKLGLGAENAELSDRVGELEAALAASQEAVARLRGLAQAVGRIRSAGKAMASSGSGNLAI